MPPLDPSALSGATALVTGGAGFIGSHLVRLLLDSGVSSVRLVDDLSSGTPDNLPADCRIQWMRQDIRNLSLDDWAPLLREHPHVFHLAARKHPSTAGDPLALWETNLTATSRLIDACRRARVPKFVFASSLYAHGGRTLPPLREDDPALPPTPYGLTKRSVETLLEALARQGALASFSLRLFFTYGPRQDAHGAYRSVIASNFLRLLGGHPPIIRGDGRQTLDYVDVADVADAFLHAAMHPAPQGLCNIGSGKGLDILALTRLMQDIAGTSFDPKNAPADETHGTQRVAGTTRAAELLSWRASTPPEQGLRAMFDWLKSAQ